MAIVKLIILSLLLIIIYCKKNIIVLPLIRESLNQNQWIYKSSQSSNSICVDPDFSKFIYSKEIQLPINCSKQDIVRIQQECIFKNVAYNTQVKIEDNIYNLTIDITTPWTWLQSPICKNCQRDGQFINNNCQSNKQQINYQNNIFSCQKCNNINKCGEIDQFAEGLSVIGQFIKTNISLGANSKILDYKLLWVHAMSGQDYLLSDGILGLGQEFEENEDQYQDLWESDTGLLHKIKSQNKQINDRIFSIYISESDNIKPQITFGQWQNQTIFQSDKNTLKWIPIPDDESIELYFYWRVPIGLINIKNQLTKIDKNIHLLNDKAYLSYQTTVIILPTGELQELVQDINNMFQINCNISEKYLYFVVCYNLSSQLNLTGLQLTIMLSDSKNVPLIIDPNYLIQSCKEIKKTKLINCQLNLQQSYNGKTILGEAALRNTYVVFDRDKKRIGFAPAVSKYNQQSLFTNIITEIEDVVQNDIVFLFRFLIVIVVLSAVLMSFLYCKKILKWLELKIKYYKTIDLTELAHLDLNKQDKEITQNQHIKLKRDDSDIRKHIEDMQDHDDLDDTL